MLPHLGSYPQQTHPSFVCCVFSTSANKANINKKLHRLLAVQFFVRKIRI